MIGYQRKKKDDLIFFSNKKKIKDGWKLDEEDAKHWIKAGWLK